jgi:SM-20-related protein
VANQRLPHHEHCAVSPESDWRPAALALTERGYAVLPAAMPEAGWRGLRAEAEHLFADDAFSAAGIGRGEGVRKESAIRGGSICWLDANASMPAGHAFMSWMEGLRVSLNRDLFLGLDSFDAHYAHYPTGASYGTHVDRHHHSNARVVSVVIYLNSDWPADAGGEFVIYDAHDVPRLTLAPDGGTLVLFMSDDTLHEARKATRARWSIAGWFRTRA